MKRTTKQRKSTNEWEKIIADFQQSSLSAAAFCRQEKIAYISFCKWRKKLSVESTNSNPQTSPFIDLRTITQPDAQWRIVLKLGNGVELLLSQSQ